MRRNWLFVTLLFTLFLIGCGGGGGGGGGGDNGGDDGGTGNDGGGDDGGGDDGGGDDGGGDDGGGDDGGGDDGGGDDGGGDPEPTTFSISGKLIPAAGISFDVDVNDPFAATGSNDTLETAQAIDNLISLHGFASAEGTNGVGLEGRFAEVGDEYDFFKVHLQAGQQIQLQIIDYEEFDLLLAGDLDLGLFDANGDLVDESLGITQYESLQAPESGDYYIGIYAYSGISKYVLRTFSSSQSASLPKTVHSDFVPGEMVLKLKPSVDANKVGQLAKAQALKMQHQDASRLILAKFETSVANASLKPAGATGNGMEKFATLQKIKAMRAQSDVAYAEPNYIRQPLATPDDRLYSYQWHYPLIDLPQAWEITTGESAEPVIVAVIDTGVYLAHPDLSNQLIAGYDFVQDPSRARDGDGIDNNPDDPGDSDVRGNSSFHGTHVAGTIAAESNDGYGAAGIAWNAQIMPVRVLGVGGGTDYDIAQGILYAAGLPNDSGGVPARRADIINMSLGGPDSSQLYVDAISQAHDAGVIIIAAAGNSDTDQVFYPAGYDGVVSVSAVDINAQITPYSNYGQTIDLAAPGGDGSVDLNNDGYPDGVLSTIADDSSGEREPAWLFNQGTSMASPHVAGVAALMKAVYPGLTPDDFDSLLQNGDLTEDIGDTGKDQLYGYGLINAARAVNAALELADGGTTPTPSNPYISVMPSSVTFGQASQISLSITNQGGGDPAITQIDNPVTWLTVAADNVDANNLGDYLLTVDRTGLGDGYYQAALTIYIDANPSLEVLVTMQVGSVAGVSELQKQYVVLADSETLDSLVQVEPVESAEGLTYQFDDIAPGSYVIATGTDIDNDQVICDSGESCGSYPSLNDLEIINVVDEDLTNIDMLVDLLGSITTSSMSNNTDGNTRVNSNRQGLMLRRLPSASAEQNQ